MKVPCFESTEDRANTVLETNGLFMIQKKTNTLLTLNTFAVMANNAVFYFEIVNPFPPGLVNNTFVFIYTRSVGCRFSAVAHHIGCFTVSSRGRLGGSGRGRGGSWGRTWDCCSRG